MGRSTRQPIAGPVQRGAFFKSNDATLKLAISSCTMSAWPVGAAVANAVSSTRAGGSDGYYTLASRFASMGKTLV
jgi:hypothetical protein